jgi:hypothetical protein
VPAFETLYLNIWGEETRAKSREFAMVLWKEGVRIVVSWDWRSARTEEYTDIMWFLRGVDEGVVAKMLLRRDRNRRTKESRKVQTVTRLRMVPCLTRTYHHSYHLFLIDSSIDCGQGRMNTVWREVSEDEDEGSKNDMDNDTFNSINKPKAIILPQ